MKPVTPEQWQSISAYLDRALELEEPARAEWLEALAQSDPGIAELLSRVLANREQEGFSRFLAGSTPIPLDAGSGAFGVAELDAARLAIAQGAPSLARTHLQRGLDIFNAASEPRPSQVIAYSLLADCDQQLGDNAAAEQAAALALERAQAMRSGFEHTAWRGTALLAKAVALSGRGDDAGALPLLFQARAELEDAAGPESSDLRKVKALIERLSTPSRHAD